LGRGLSPLEPPSLHRRRPFQSAAAWCTRLTQLLRPAYLIVSPPFLPPPSQPALCPGLEVPPDDGERDEEDRGQQHPGVHCGRALHQGPDPGRREEDVRHPVQEGQHAHQVSTQFTILLRYGTSQQGKAGGLPLRGGRCGSLSGGGVLLARGGLRRGFPHSGGIPQGPGLQQWGFPVGGLSRRGLIWCSRGQGPLCGVCLVRGDWGCELGSLCFSVLRSRPRESVESPEQFAADVLTISLPCANASVQARRTERRRTCA